MKKNYLFIAIAICIINIPAFGQRYLTETFSSVTVTDNIKYGENFSVLTGTPVLQDLNMTVYQPSGDTETERPLFIYLHTGNFLPKGINKSTTGTRSDSSVVEICTRLAKLGYVVASIDYRLGWNPLAPVQEERTGTLLRAVYRALQDTRTAARFFRKDHATAGNNYGIDPNKISVMGQGSGGYVALAAATLDKLEEIQLNKFYDFTNNKPFVDTTILGDFEGLGGYPSLNNNNHAGYSSDFMFCTNLGGALGDSIWLENNDIPMVAFHCPNDPFAPYKFGTVIVPTTGDFVVSVSGSYEAIRLADHFGNNYMMKQISGDPFTSRAQQINNGITGLFPFVTMFPEPAPWDWWDPNDPNDSLSTLTNQNMSKPKAMAYIDTIIGYLAPRAYNVIIQYGVDVNDAAQFQSAVSVYPNPTSGTINVVGNDPILEISIIDLQGQIVKNTRATGLIKNSMDVSDLSKGAYFIKVISKSKNITQKIILE